MIMFATLDLMTSGTALWTTLTRYYPFPLKESDLDYAQLHFNDSDVFVVVCDVVDYDQDGVDDDYASHVELEVYVGHKVVLHVNLSRDLMYLNGHTCGNCLDELGAIDVLSLYLPIHSGYWTCIADDESDGDHFLFGNPDGINEGAVA